MERTELQSWPNTTFARYKSAFYNGDTRTRTCTPIGFCEPKPTHIFIGCGYLPSALDGAQPVGP